MKKFLLSVFSKSEEETSLVAERYAGICSRGTIIALKGDLGAGKTHFVKGFVKGLGSSDLVTSPTFTLLNVYEGGKERVYHFDMYRLSSADEARELGFDEYFDAKTLDGIVLVEWPEQVEGLINPPYLEIEIQKEGTSERKLIFSMVEGE